MWLSNACVAEHRMVSLLPLLLVVSSAALAHAGDVLVYNYNQCGGTGGLCKIKSGVPCVDAQYAVRLRLLATDGGTPCVLVSAGTACRLTLADHMQGYKCGSKLSTCTRVSGRSVTGHPVSSSRTQLATRASPNPPSSCPPPHTPPTVLCFSAAIGSAVTISRDLHIRRSSPRRTPSPLAKSHLLFSVAAPAAHASRRASAKMPSGPRCGCHEPRLLFSHSSPSRTHAHAFTVDQLISAHATVTGRLRCCQWHQVLLLPPICSLLAVRHQEGRLSCEQNACRGYPMGHLQNGRRVRRG